MNPASRIPARNVWPPRMIPWKELTTDERNDLILKAEDILNLNRCRALLLRMNLVDSPIRLAGYYQFIRNTFFSRKGYRNNDALARIQADAEQFVSWGYDAHVLVQLAALQGVRLSLQGYDE